MDEDEARVHIAVCNFIYTSQQFVYELHDRVKESYTQCSKLTDWELIKQCEKEYDFICAKLYNVKSYLERLTKLSVTRHINSNIEEIVNGYKYFTNLVLRILYDEVLILHKITVENHITKDYMVNLWETMIIMSNIVHNS